MEGPRTSGGGAGWLRMTAVILGGVALLQVLRFNGVGVRGPAEDGLARAEMVTTSGSLTLMTAGAGNEDVLVALDQRSEILYVYRTDTRHGVQLMQTLPLQQLFSEARARTLGRP